MNVRTTANESAQPAMLEQSAMNPLDQFRDALAARDILPPADIIADGQIHRADCAGKNGKGDAAYLLFLDHVPAGGMENHRDGRGWEPWRADIGRDLSVTEQTAHEARLAALRAKRRGEDATRAADTKRTDGRLCASEAHQPRSDGAVSFIPFVPAGDDAPGIAVHLAT